MNENELQWMTDIRYNIFIKSIWNNIHLKLLKKLISVTKKSFTFAKGDSFITNQDRGGKKSKRNWILCPALHKSTIILRPNFHFNYISKETPLSKWIPVTIGVKRSKGKEEKKEKGEKNSNWNWHGKRTAINVPR